MKKITIHCFGQHKLYWINEWMQKTYNIHVTCPNLTFMNKTKPVLRIQFNPGVNVLYVFMANCSNCFLEFPASQMKAIISHVLPLLVEMSTMSKICQDTKVYHQRSEMSVWTELKHLIWDKNLICIFFFPACFEVCEQVWDVAWCSDNSWKNFNLALKHENPRFVTSFQAYIQPLCIHEKRSDQ